MFDIPKGLRPVRTSVPQGQTARSEPENTPRTDSAAVRGTGKSDSRWEAGRAYSIALAKKLRSSRRFALPPPRRMLCCCGPGRVKDERSASFVELSKLLAMRDEQSCP